MKTEALKLWTIDDAAELYGIRHWGSGYFDISPGGRVIVRPRGPGSDVTVDLFGVIQDLRHRGFCMPVLLRFADILSGQVRLLNESFRDAIRKANYQGSYRGVYPIKVNQKEEVVRDIIEFGGEFHHGLEAGSKAELIAAISSMKDPDAFVVCNGYKDEEFVDLALYALKMGVQTYIVIEMPCELDLVLSRARQLGVRPALGVRAKLFTRAGGHWDGSGGDRSKFGMDSMQIVDLTDVLRREGMLDCLRILHYHLGSQVPDIRRVRMALQEACRTYLHLKREGAAMGMLNVGGGLAVDYDGSHTNFAGSRNYTIEEYATDVVEVIMDILDEAGVEHPMIISESGRATVAHHSVLVFNVLHASRFEPHSIPDQLPEDTSEMLANLLEAQRTLSPRNVQEAYHDALYYRDELRSMFLQGKVSLRERAIGEDIFWHVIRRIADMVGDWKYVPDEMQGLEPAIADVYYGNFSLFQSLPDSWAIDQIFPVMPIHRLNERPSRQAVIADISCDSDGQIDRFTDLHDEKHALPLHELNTEEYYLGVFLVGAYQETLGDMHNLLGAVNVVHCRLGPDGRVEYIREEPGDNVAEVLSYVEYNPKELQRAICRKAAEALKAGIINDPEKDAIIRAFSEGMQGYTYFER